MTETIHGSDRVLVAPAGGFPYLTEPDYSLGFRKEFYASQAYNTMWDEAENWARRGHLVLMVQDNEHPPNWYVYDEQRGLRCGNPFKNITTRGSLAPPQEYRDLPITRVYRYDPRDLAQAVLAVEIGTAS